MKNYFLYLRNARADDAKNVYSFFAGFRAFRGQIFLNFINRRHRGIYPVFSLFFAVIFSLSLSLQVFAQGKVVISVSAETTIETDRVTLGDIAKFSGSGTAAAKRLETISLGYAPGVGMTRELFKDRILLSITAAGLSKNDFLLNAPPKIIVRRSAQVVGQSLFKETVEKAVLANFQSENISTKVVRLDLPANIDLPSGKIDVRANLANVNNFFSPFSVSLEVRVDDQVVKRISATVQVEATTEVLVAAKDLITGGKITGIDVKKETRRLERPLGNYLRDEKNLRGMVLLKNLPAGSEITTDAVAAGYVIRGGDMVRIVGESGRMEIIISGEARSSGRIGDRIAVKNSQSGTILQATVVDEGLVKVLF